MERVPVDLERLNAFAAISARWPATVHGRLPTRSQSGSAICGMARRSTCSCSSSPCSGSKLLLCACGTVAPPRTPTQSLASFELVKVAGRGAESASGEGPESERGGERTRGERKVGSMMRNGGGAGKQERNTTGGDQRDEKNTMGRQQRDTVEGRGSTYTSNRKHGPSVFASLANHLYLKLLSPASHVSACFGRWGCLVLTFELWPAPLLPRRLRLRPLAAAFRSLSIGV